MKGQNEHPEAPRLHINAPDTHQLTELPTDPVILFKRLRYRGLSDPWLVNALDNTSGKITRDSTSRQITDFYSVLRKSRRFFVTTSLLCGSHGPADVYFPGGPASNRLSLLVF